jgi:hypothetical protein
MTKFSKFIKGYGIVMVLVWLVSTATYTCPKPDPYGIKSCAEQATFDIYIHGVVWPFYLIWKLTNH